MSCTVKRYNFLDNETNIGTADLRSLVDNGVYTAAVDTKNLLIKASDGLDKALTSLNGKLSDLKETAKNLTSKIAAKISSVLDGVVNKLMSIELPDFVKKVLDKLKGLNLDGVKSFLKDVLKIGSAFLCSNLDLLKNVMLGYAVSGNILSGLLLGLALSWLDKFCKGFSQEETAASGNKSLLGMLVGSSGIKINKDNVLGTFTGVMSSVVASGKGFIASAVLPASELIGKVMNGEPVKQVMSLLEGAEVGSGEKKGILASIGTALGDLLPTDVKYKDLLQLQGDIHNLPIVNYGRQVLALSTSNSKDALGSLALNLASLDLDTINTNSMTDTQKSMFGKLEDFKFNLSKEFDLQQRNHEEGSFLNYDFNKVLPTFTSEENILIAQSSPPNDVHRYNGLHPTSGVFIESTIPNVAKPDRTAMIA